MTRIEKHASVTQQLEEMEEKVVRQVRGNQRRKRPMLACSLFILFLVVSFFVWIGWVIAATGLVSIPLLTQIAYETPAPIRVVEPGVPVEVFVDEQLKSALTTRLQSGSGEIQDRSVTLTISEESFTATLRSLIDELGVAFLDGSGAQLALDPNSGIELFVPILNNPRASAIVVSLDVGVTDGNVSITPARLRVGSAGLPTFLLTGLLNPLLQTQVEKLNDSLTGYAQIHSVTLKEMEMTLIGELSVEIQ
ncbi:MAG: hypothetical protein WC654_03125 [Patescibacteria group bacterium]